MTPEEIEAIVMAEYKYWRDAFPDNEDLMLDAITMGATGACANIIGAIHGHRAAWHPQQLPSLSPQPLALSPEKS